jgi:hypothetical protein
MYRTIFISILSTLIFFLACKKEEEAKVVLPPTNFQPISAGSVWTYAEYPVTNLYTTYCNGVDSVFNKKVYYEMFTTNSGYTWVRKENGFYYRLVPNSDTVIEFIYLKDNAPVGASWQKSYEIDGFPTTFKYLLLEYDQPRLIYGNVYDHCITIREQVYVDFGTVSDSLMSSRDYTYANDVGLVYTNMGTLGQVYLKSYNIHP